jgi:phospholipase C
LGFRVPLIIASPWSRGGYVNSETFDLTSTIQFLEKFLSIKTGKEIKDANISKWRRTVCGDLTSVFRYSADNEAVSLELLQKDPFMESVYSARFKKLPDDFKALNPEEISLFRKNPYDSPYMPQQEKGIRPSNGLFYQLFAEGILNKERKSINIHFESGNMVFGDKTLGSAFNVYAPGKYLQNVNGSSVFRDLRTWAFAVNPSGHVDYSWPLESFENDIYHLRVYGPNGFFREYLGSTEDPSMEIKCNYEIEGKSQIKLTGNINLVLHNTGRERLTIIITDNAYQTGSIEKSLNSSAYGSGKINVPLNLSKQFGWYDFTVSVEGSKLFMRRYAGRVDTGESGFSDPYMGRTI